MSLARSAAASALAALALLALGAGPATAPGLTKVA